MRGEAELEKALWWERAGQWNTLHWLEGPSQLETDAGVVIQEMSHGW